MAAPPEDALFLDPSLDWQPVSPKLTTERRLPWLGLLVIAAVLVVIGSLVGGTTLTVLFLVAAAAIVGWAIAWFITVPRITSNWRYVEREQDLLVRRGRLFRQLTVVPYGRMQVIEVSANPVSQHLGIATVTLVTASASTDARIPGVPSTVAHELRDRLAAKGEASAAGL